MASFKELTVWQKSMDLANEVYILCKRLPKEETYAISDQMRRAAVSIPSNIAEGQRRRTPKDFLHFLSIADGSCAELETQLLLTIRAGMLTEEETGKALSILDEVERMLNSLMSAQRLKTND